MKNKVYIIIVNYTTFADTIECLESVLKSDYSDFQLIIIDNSPNNLSVSNLLRWASNNDYAGVKTRFSHLVFPLENKPVSHKIISEFEFKNSTEIFEEKIIIIKAKNKGFAAANNIGLRYILKNASDNSLIWILNNDTVVEKDTLNNLVRFYLKSQGNKYIFSSILKYYNKPNVIQAIGGTYNKWLGKHYHIGEGEEDSGQYNNYNFGEMDYVVGASIFLPKLFIEQAGMMCEDYFLYFEEIDWIKNSIKHGFTIALVPNATVYHKEGSSTIELKNNQKDTSLAEYYSITNRVRFIKKWYPICLFTVIPGVIWALLKRLFLGKFGLVKKISISIFDLLFSVKSSVFKY